MSNSQDENQGQSKPGIRIVDRRRFDSAGEEKVEVSSDQPVTPNSDETNHAKFKTTRAASSVPSENSEFIMQEPENLDQQAQEEDISFGSFVLSLATQALMQLGQLKAPDGMSIPVDPAAAHQTIDILAMLQSKTKGNLDAKEDGLLRDALQSLRVAFLKNR